MTGEVLQFGGKPKISCRERLSAYAVIFNPAGELLVLKVGDGYHLPGGGIDKNEEPTTAVMREAMEEAGCEIGNLSYIGKANQFFPKYDLNKLGTFYRAELISYNPEKSVEDTHEECWVRPEEFLSGNSGEFQKWAVQEALG